MDGVDASEALTDQQRRVVNAPAEAQLIVVAGPGAGKTHTLVHRVERLIDHDGLSSDEIAILSFTNDVVRELAGRVSCLVDVHVRPTTIDGLAGRVVARVDGDVPVGFDSTMRRAIDILENGLVRNQLAEIRHVIVDEIQDLLELRQEFVHALIRHVGSGFTALGDSAQGIYGFSRSVTRRPRADSVEAMCAAFPEAVRVELTGEHRSRRSGASPVLDLRGMVEFDHPEAYVELRRRLRECEQLRFDDLALILHRTTGSTGVLCRNNGEVLLLADRLSSIGVKHRVRHGATSRTAPRWVARVLSRADDDALTRRRFEELAGDVSADKAADAWRAMRRIAGDRDGRVRLGDLRSRVERLEPVDLDGVPSVPVLSTVHRSKGLQYETCVILEPSDVALEDQPDEARILFVAMTRARNATLCLKREPSSNGRLTQRRQRWHLLTWKGSGVLGVELRSGDTSDELEEGAPGMSAESQRRLADIETGEAVELVRSDSAFDIVHRDTVIGRTSPSFDSFGSNLPQRITGARVDRVRTAAGDPRLTERLGLGAGGFWLVPELIGMARPVWSESDD